MLSPSLATRIFLALTPVDGRKSFNGLYSLVKETLQQEPTSGYLFVFTNRHRNRVKILFWDGSGLCLFCKRLERGTYAWPAGQGASRSLRPEELQLLLHGIEGQPRRRWYRTA
jgi:transposase